MLTSAPIESRHSHLHACHTVDFMWAMGTTQRFHTHCPLQSRLPTVAFATRGLFCGQLLTRVLNPLAEAAIA
jgi:hypothetical protein